MAKIAIMDIKAIAAKDAKNNFGEMLYKRFLPRCLRKHDSLYSLTRSKSGYRKHT